VRSLLLHALTDVRVDQLTIGIIYAVHVLLGTTGYRLSSLCHVTSSTST